MKHILFFPGLQGFFCMLESEGSQASSAFCLVPQRSDKKTVQLIGESLAIFPAERRWTTRHQAAVPQFAQQITHGEPVFDVFLCVEFAPGAEGRGALGDDSSRQGNVGRNH